MKTPECPGCAQTDQVSLFTRSEPIASPGHPTVQWVAYLCKRCGTAYVRLEPVAT